MKNCRAYLIVGMTIFLLNVFATTPETGAERFVAVRGKIINPPTEESSVGEALIYVCRTFNMPISLESSYVGQSRETIEVPTKGPFRIKPGDTLAQTLDQLCSIEPGRYEWSRRNGSFVVMPPPGAELVESTLDTIMSINIENVSPWEALCAIAKTVNGSGTTDRILEISPAFLMSRREGPTEFSEGNEISLNLTDVSARDAILVVIQQSSLSMDYRYSNYYRPGIYEDSLLKSHLRIQPVRSGEKAQDYPRMDAQVFLNKWKVDIDAQLSTFQISPVPSPAQQE